MDQAEQTQAKPRRRRRWLIVIVVLVFLASVLWWNWPRGDARFVGTWTYCVFEANGTATPTSKILMISSNGRISQFVNGVEQLEHPHWWVEGNEFVVEPDWHTGLAELQQMIRIAYGNMTGHPLVRPRLRNRIGRCSASEIILGSAALLRRISE